MNIDSLIEDNNEEKAIEFLKTNTNDWIKIENAWKLTFNYRLAFLKLNILNDKSHKLYFYSFHLLKNKSGSELSTADYIDKFPCLKTENAYRLVMTDK